MKVIVDDKIPFIREAIESIADEVIFIPGKEFTPAIVKDADALIVRTRTLCNRKLLKGSKVKFIATATIGYDHIDTAYCKEAGIAWTNAPGCNSNSVAEYIESALVLLKRRDVALEDMTMGIIGAGNVGSRVATKARGFNMKVLENDPPRAAAEGNGKFCSLEEIAENCDIISFHTPLIMDGEYKTFHLADEKFFQSLKKRPIIINTSRGEVIDTQALLNAINCERVSDVIIDVWEREPNIDLRLLHHAFIATPHIAGYSADGKANATRMALEALCKFFDIEPDFEITITPRPRITAKWILHNYNNIPLRAYDPTTDTQKLKAHPEKFEEMRNNHPTNRRESEVYYKAWDKHVIWRERTGIYSSKK